MNKMISIACSLLLMSMTSLNAVGQQSFNYQTAGTIDGIDLGSSSIVIGDLLYRLSPNLQVRDKNNNHAGLTDLVMGKKVGINTYGNRPELYVSEIRILPDDFDLEKYLNEDDD